MAGESPGREQQHETSGEVVDRIAADPRLAVFGRPTGTSGAREAGTGTDSPRMSGEEAAAGTAVKTAAAPASHTPRAPSEPDAAAGGATPASPRSAPASTPAAPANTPDDVSDVDAASAPDTPSTADAAPTVPREAAARPAKTEPNRDVAPEAPEAGDSAGAADADEVEPGEAVATAAAATPTAPGTPRPAAAHPGDSDRDGDGDGDAVDEGEAEAEGHAGAETGAGAGEGAEGAGEGESDAGSGSESAEPEAESASESAEPDAGSDDAGTDDGPDGTGTEDAGPGPRKPAEDGDGGQDGDGSRDGDGDRGTRILRPLVSDLYGRKPAEGGSGATVTLGVPGRPTRARTAPAAPAKPPLPPKPAATPKPPATPPPAERPVPAEPGPTKPLTVPTPAVERPGAQPPATEPAAAAPAAGAPEELGPDGTRNMPVPPAGQTPLKLLAELTNTPPPPPTVMRSIVRRFKIWTPLVVLLAVIFVVVQAVRPLPSPSLRSTAAGAYTFQGAPLPQSMPWPAQGQSVVEVEGLGSLGVHGAQTPVPIASLTKVMTAYVILRDHPLSGKENGPSITVDAQAAKDAQSQDESTAPVRQGQTFSERQMLQLMLIPSGNNIARLLARWDAGTQDAFVAKMKQAAASLGMSHTTYTGASGFESSTQSTAVDQLALARAVMANDVFRSVVAMPNVDIPGVGRIYNNNNDLVNYGVVGIKTGSSTPAGGALMWAARRTVQGKSQLILGVVLQQRGGTTVNDSLQLALQRSQSLINSVQHGLTSVTIVKKGEVVGQVDDGLGGRTPVVASKDLTAIGWPGMSAELTISALPSGIPHSAKAGTAVGTLSFGSGPARTSVPVTLQSDLKEPSFGTKLTRLG